MSQKIRKSSAAGFNAAKRCTVTSEYVIPCGLEYFGTHQIPFNGRHHYLHIFLTRSISGPVRSHWDIDHFDSKIFRDSKMSVVSRNRTEEFYFIKFAPWCTAHHAMCHGTCNGIIHNIQAGITKDNNIVFWYFHHISKKLSWLL